MNLRLRMQSAGAVLLQDTYEDLIGSVLEIFKPGKFLMTLMANEVTQVSFLLN